jgi:adenylate cyclase class IV
MSNEQIVESLQLEIKKEIEKLKYYVENADETINEGDFNEIKIINNRATAILDKINTLVASIQELKIDRGETARNVR